MSAIVFTRAWKVMLRRAIDELMQAGYVTLE